MAECPFSWTNQKEGCLSTRTVWKPVECLRNRCQLWTGSDCVFNKIAHQLDALKEATQQGKP